MNIELLDDWWRRRWGGYEGDGEEDKGVSLPALSKDSLAGAVDFASGGMWLESTAEKRRKARMMMRGSPRIGVVGKGGEEG
jgi:hypothetical protein